MSMQKALDDQENTDKFGQHVKTFGDIINNMPGNKKEVTVNEWFYGKSPNGQRTVGGP